MGYLLMWTYWVTVAAVMWTRTVRTTKVAPEGIRLSGVSAAFVAALEADRAADPDPARRAWFGDVRTTTMTGRGERARQRSRGPAERSQALRSA